MTLEETTDFLKRFVGLKNLQFSQYAAIHEYMMKKINPVEIIQKGGKARKKYLKKLLKGVKVL